MDCRPTAFLQGIESPTVSHYSHFLAQARIWLLTGICFVLPMRVSYVYVLTALLLLVWLAEGGWREKGRRILGSRLCLAFAAYYAVFLVAMLWTENVSAGWHMVDRQTPILLFLLYWSCADPKYRERYLLAFVAGAAVCALLAHYNLLQLHVFPDWPRGVRVHKGPFETGPFVDRIMYAPLLALAAYFSLRGIVLAEGMAARAMTVVLAGLLVSNLLFSAGRAGMVMFAALCIMLVIEFSKTWLKALLLCAVLGPLAVFAAYEGVDAFAERVDNAVTDLQDFDANQNTAVGLRLVYWMTSFDLFLHYPVLGVGSGDFQDEYARIKPANWASTPDSYNPHNQFLMTAATTGLLGLSVLLFIFYCAVREKTDMRMHAVLVGFAVVCLFESYLWRSNTALTFSVMVAVLAARSKEGVQA